MDTLESALHSVMHAAGEHAERLLSLWHIMLWTCVVMYVLVLAFLFLSILRARRKGDDDRDSPGEQRRLSVTLAGWAVLITLGLLGLTLASYVTDRSLVHASAMPQVTITITSHQWWWEIEYTDPDPSRHVRTANELHLPVNTLAQITLASADVIHTFWVPSLNGKQDMIPGRTNYIELQPRQTGWHRGMCAEFCGFQHAKMHLDVIVESPAEYKAWYERQLQSPAPPNDPQAQRGQAVFMQGPCSVCHAVAGTDASGTIGPDLSHVASRRSIAAGALRNDPSSMRAWLSNPQAIKPGNHMPLMNLQDDQLQALTAYLGSLQ
jgi:cytochrome c oxidase subunit 2